MNKEAIRAKSRKEDISVRESKVFNALRSLNAYELNRFRKFITSPYFNRNEKLIALFECFEALLRADDDTEDMTRGEAWLCSNPGKPYKDVKFRKLCSDLLRILERFLAQEVYEQNSLHQADCLLQAINQKKLENLYNSSIRTAHRLSDQYYFRPASYFYYQYAFQREIFSLSGLEVERSKVANVEKIAENLDKFYLAEKLRYYCDVLSRKDILEHDYQILFMEEIIDHIRENNYESVVPINFYYQIYLTHEDPENYDHFDTLKAIINLHIDKIPANEAREILDSARNYCIKQVNAGKLDFLREYMDLSMIGLTKDILIINGYITPWTFRNIVFAGLRLGEYEWVEQFIEQYKNKIEEKYRDNAVTFNLANLYFYSGEYDKVIEQLQAVDYDDISYNLNSKTILIATYYELDEVEALLSLLTSFNVYLRRNKQIPSSRKQLYQNLIRYMRSLTRIPVYDKEALQKFRDKVRDTELIANKGWLLDKIDELLA